MPLPSQVRMPVALSPSQVPDLQRVPCAQRRQAPLPSQVPSFPQVAGVLAAHTEGSSGVAPHGTAAQRPREFGRLQAIQVCPQAVLQQTPSTQNPIRHSRSQLQDSAVPFDWLGVSAGQVWGGATSADLPSCPPPSPDLEYWAGVQPTAARATYTKTKTGFLMDRPPRFVDRQLEQ
jgi:hypothetical protein